MEEKKSKVNVAHEDKQYQKYEEHINKSYGNALELFAESLATLSKPKITDAVNLFGEKLKDVDYLKISESVYKLLNSEAFQNIITISHNLAYLDYLNRVQWPLFLVNDETLENELFSIIGLNEEKSSTIILEYYSNKHIYELSKEWSNCDVIKEERKTILIESIKAYEMGLYTLCVSGLTCQMSGIINDITALYNKHGILFDEEELSTYLMLIEETDERKQLGKLDSEKTKLLGISQNLVQGFNFYASFILYMRDVVYTSENKMSSSNHPCRNKICHGDQVNFGTKEHALKAILIVDSLIKIANMSKTKIIKIKSAQDY